MHHNVITQSNKYHAKDKSLISLKNFR